MKNKIYFSIIILLIPLTIISFNREKQLTENADNLQDKKTIIVLKNNNEITIKLYNMHKITHALMQNAQKRTCVQ